MVSELRRPEASFLLKKSLNIQSQGMVEKVLVAMSRQTSILTINANELVKFGAM